jgi:hypothetical protein
MVELARPPAICRNTASVVLIGIANPGLPGGQEQARRERGPQHRHDGVRQHVAAAPAPEGWPVSGVVKHLSSPPREPPGGEGGPGSGDLDPGYGLEPAPPGMASRAAGRP